MGGWIFLLLIEALLTALAIELLVRQLPASVRDAIAENKRRLDGSYSMRRSRAESWHLRQLRCDLLMAFFVLLVPTNFAIYLFDQHVMPISLGLETLQTWHASPDEWKQALRDSGVKARYDSWHTIQRRQGPDLSLMSDAATVDRTARVTAARRTLFRIWPMILLGGVAWCILAVALLGRWYLLAVGKLKRGADFRAQQYLYRDVSRFRVDT